MNGIVNKFLLVGDKYMPEMHLKQPGFTYSTCGSFIKNKEILKSLCKLEIWTLFIKVNLIRLVFSMIWLMGNQKIKQKEHNQIKFWEIKYLKLQVIQNMMDIKKD